MGEPYLVAHTGYWDHKPMWTQIVGDLLEPQ